MRILLYTGKGGVGKTTIAAATAVNSKGMLLDLRSIVDWVIEHVEERGKARKRAEPRLRSSKERGVA